MNNYESVELFKVSLPEKFPTMTLRGYCDTLINILQFVAISSIKVQTNLFPP
jgi:hypothetical protein